MSSSTCFIHHPRWWPRELCAKKGITSRAILPQKRPHALRRPRSILSVSLVSTSHHEVISSGIKLVPLRWIYQCSVFFWMVFRSKIIFRQSSSKPCRLIIQSDRGCRRNDTVYFCLKFFLRTSFYVRSSYSPPQLFWGQRICRLEREALGWKDSVDHGWKLSRCNRQWTPYTQRGEGEGLGYHHVCFSMQGQDAPYLTSWVCLFLNK